MRLLSNCDRREDDETVEVETNCYTKKIDGKFLLSFSALAFFCVANWGRGKGGICSHSLALTHFKLKQKFWHLSRKLERAELWNMAKCLPAVFLEMCWQLEKSSGSWKLIFLYALILRRLSRKAKLKTIWMSWQNFLIFTKANSLGSSWLVRHVGNRRVD